MVAEESWIDFNKRLIQNRRRSLKGRSWINTLLILAHGNSESMNIGLYPTDKYYSLTVDSIHQWKKDPYLDFVNDGRIILHSCSTGIHFGKVLEEKLGLSVQAPEINIYGCRIKKGTKREVDFLS